MSSITLLDNLGFDVSITGGNGTSSLAKYLPGELKFLFDLPTFSSSQTLPVSEVAEKILPFKLTAKLSGSFGIAGVAKLSVKEGQTASLSICKDKASTELLTAFDRKPAALPVYLSFQTGLNAEVAAAGTVNEFTFGMAAGDQIQVTNYRSCDPATTLLDATRAVIQGFTLPITFEDLLAMSAGTVFKVEGKGTLTFSAAVGYKFINNPLATIKAPFIKAPTINAAGSADLKFSVEVSGGFQVSILKDTSNTVVLGVGRSRGLKSTVDLTVKAGLELEAVGTDVLALVLGQIAPDPKQIERLKQLPAEDRKEIETAIKGALESNCAAGVTAEFSRETDNGVLFLYELDLNKLQDTSKKAAVNAALRGDYSSIGPLAAVENSGVVEKRAVYSRAHKATRKLTIHLLNLFQFSDVSSLILNGRVQVSPDSGALVITDKATASQIQASTGSLHADAKKLRSLLFTSAMVTAAYQGTKALLGAPSVSFQFEFFSMHANTPVDVMRHELTALAAIGAVSQTQMKSVLGSGNGRFGSTSLNLAIRLDPVSSERLFLANGQALTMDAYENVGRKAMLTLLQNDSDPASRARIDQLQSDAYTRITGILNQSGKAGFETAFENLPEPVQADIFADHEVIVWWAEAMANFAKALQNMQSQVKQSGGFNPNGAAFKKLQSDFERKAAEVASTTKDRFDVPWGAMTLYLSLLPESKVDASFTSAALTIPAEITIAAAGSAS